MSGLGAMLQNNFIKICAFLIILTCFVTVTLSQAPTDWSNRWLKTNTVIAMQGPYTWGDSVYCAAADYTVSSSRIVCEMRVTDSCVITCDLRNKTGLVIRACAGDIFRLDITKIYMTGTDASVRSGNKIRLFGF
jgi:hypothetical protein